MGTLVCPLCSSQAFTTAESLWQCLYIRKLSGFSCSICLSHVSDMEALIDHLVSHLKRPDQSIEGCVGSNLVLEDASRGSLQPAAQVPMCLVETQMVVPSNNAPECNMKSSVIQEEIHTPCFPLDMETQPSGNHEGMSNCDGNLQTPFDPIQSSIDDFLDPQLQSFGDNAHQNGDSNVEGLAKNCDKSGGYLQNNLVNSEEGILRPENRVQKPVEGSSESLHNPGSIVMNLGDSLPDVTFAPVNEKLTPEVQPEAHDVKTKMKNKKNMFPIGDPSFACCECNVAFNNTYHLRYHEIVVHNKDAADIVCHICKEFHCGSLTQLDSHLRSHNDQGCYLCPLCPRSFKLRGSLLVHQRMYHDKQSLLKLATDKMKANSGVEGGGKDWSCSECNKSFGKAHLLVQHRRTHQPKQWQCTVCNKHFTTKYFLKKHIRLHTGERPFECESCGKRFRQRVSYLVHQRIHTGEMPYKCDKCERSFRYKVSLRSHKCEATDENSESPKVTQKKFMQKLIDTLDKSIEQDSSVEAQNDSSASSFDVNESNNRQETFWSQHSSSCGFDDAVLKKSQYFSPQLEAATLHSELDFSGANLGSPEQDVDWLAQWLKQVSAETP